MKALLFVALLCIFHCTFAGEFDDLRWIKHLRVGDVIFAKDSDLEQIANFVEKNQDLEDGSSCFRSLTSDKAEDESEEIHDKNDRQKQQSFYLEEEDAEISNCEKSVDGFFYYPEYAVGLLENGCTAFLVGPFHAMTSASCVYKQQQRLWETEIDFWRARNDTAYHQKMQWEEVYISKMYFDSQDPEYDWALILMGKDSPSPVWHSFKYCPDECPGPIMTTYNYKKDILYSKVCRGAENTECFKQLELECCESSDNGGPVFEGYGRKFPSAVVGIIPAEYSNSKTKVAVKFDSDLFWSTCFFVSMSSGVDPGEYCFKE